MARKASVVRFACFPFTKAQIEKFRTPNAQVILGLIHPNYSHMVLLPEAARGIGVAGS